MIHVTTHGDLFAIRSPFEAKDAIKSLPGARWNSGKRVWTMPATRTALLPLLAADTPITRLAVETIPSLAPSTAARSHPIRWVMWFSGCFTVGKLNRLLLVAGPMFPMYPTYTHDIEAIGRRVRGCNQLCSSGLAAQRKRQHEC